MAHYRSICWILLLLQFCSFSIFSAPQYSGGMGHGAWMFDSPSNTVVHVAAYQKHVPRKGMPLRLVISPAGSIRAAEGQGQVTLSLSNAVQTAAMLPAAQVFARIQVSSALAAQEALDWEALASDCLGPVQQHAQLRGILLDADESGPGLLALSQALLQQATNRVVAVAAPTVDPLLAQSCGLVILKAFDLAESPREYRRALKPRLEEFLAQVGPGTTPFMIGVPLAASSREFETKTLPDGTSLQSSYSMIDFLRSALLQIDLSCAELGESYAGLCLWAYQAPDVAGQQRSPTLPIPSMYRIINLPPCR